MGAAQLLRLAHLLGDETFATTGIPHGAQDIDEAQRQRLAKAVTDGLEAIVGRLVEEALASDDVTDASSARVYAEDQLAFLADLITEEQRAAISREFAARTMTLDVPTGQPPDA